MATVVDFTGVEGRGTFELLPAGDYLLRVAGAEERDSESSEYQYLNLEFEVMEPEEFTGRKIWDVCSYSPAALWKLKNFLLAAGYSEEELAGEFEFSAEDLLDGEVWARVKQIKDKRNEGQMRNSINTYSPA